MHFDRAHQILWDHFGWEYDDLFGPCGLDEVGPANDQGKTKRDWIIDSYDNCEGYAREWDGDRRESVEHAAAVWLGGVPVG